MERDFVGPVSSQWLREIGIHSLAELRVVGIEEAFRLMVLRGFPVNASLLYGLDSALEGKKWSELSEARKSALRTVAAKIKKTATDFC